MLDVTVNTIGKKMAETYGQTTGDSILCSLPAPVHEFNEEEHEILQSDNDEQVSVMFSRSGKFKFVGFRGEWYRPITVPQVKDMDIVFSSENLKQLDLIEEIGRASDGSGLATMAMGM